MSSPSPSTASSSTASSSTASSSTASSSTASPSAASPSAAGVVANARHVEAEVEAAQDIAGAEKTAEKLSAFLNEGKELDDMSHELVRAGILLLLVAGVLLWFLWRFF